MKRVQQEKKRNMKQVLLEKKYNINVSVFRTQLNLYDGAFLGK